MRVKSAVCTLLLLLLSLFLITSASSAAVGRDATAGDTSSRAFLPLVARPSPDLTITHLEVTQGIQDQTNTVPLVENRPTTVRVYAQVNSARDPVSAAVSLTAYRDGHYLGSLWLDPRPVPALPAQSTYGSTFNLSLPQSWLSGRLTLRATVDATGLVEEANEDNNSYAWTADFGYVPPLSLKLVPINYTHLPTGTYFPGYPADDAELIAYLLKIFPLHAVNISYHAPIAWSGDLSQGAEWSRLMNDMAGLKVSEGAPFATAYYGLIPTTNANRDTYPRAWGGYGAIGWMRAAVGVVEGGGSLLAHELGHNFGRRHAPCGNPAGVDANYPYPGASIGQFGLDLGVGRVWTPWEPDFARDLMSYCGPRWVSDYTYRALYADQLVASSRQPPAPGPGLLVRVAFDRDGNATFLPTYSLSNTPPTPLPEESAYTVELLDEAGELIAAYPAVVFEAEEHGYASRAVSAVLRRPQEPVHQLRLRYQGTTIATRALAAAEPATIVRGGAGIRQQASLTWENGDRPALVRYTADDGLTWTTLGLDVSGGQLPLPPGGAVDEGGAFEITFGR